MERNGEQSAKNEGFGIGSVVEALEILKRIEFYLPFLKSFLILIIRHFI
jgi:hypothetical protein